MATGTFYGYDDLFSDPEQSTPRPVTATGWYGATGFKFSNSALAPNLGRGRAWARFLHDLEFVGRYEAYQNVAAESLATPDTATDLFKTRVWTAGLNYYVKGDNAKFQANYLWVKDPVDVNRGLREIKNNVFVLNFQLAF